MGLFMFLLAVSLFYFAFVSYLDRRQDECCEGCAWTRYRRMSSGECEAFNWLCSKCSGWKPTPEYETIDMPMTNAWLYDH